MLSDPRRSATLLKGLVDTLALLGAKKLIAKTEENEIDETIKNSIASIVPKGDEDQQALLQWAYFEASTIVRQYGDLLEELQIYLRTGTASVGECSLLLENELIM